MGYALNEYGQVAGEGYIWTPDVSNGQSGAKTANAQFSYGAKLNGNGQVASVRYDPFSNLPVGILFTPATKNGGTGSFVSFLGLPRQEYTRPDMVVAGIAGDGSIVAYDHYGNFKSFVWKPSTGATPILVPAGFSQIIPTAVNDAGDIVGYVMTEPSLAVVPFVYKDGILYNLTTVSHLLDNGTATGINNKGQIVVAAGGTLYLVSPTLPPANAVPVTISASPANGRALTVVGSGCRPGSYTTPQTLQWTPGASCTVAFTSPQSTEPGMQYAFTGWQDGNALASRVISTPGQATTYTAVFSPQHYVTTNAIPQSGGTVGGGGWITASSVANLTAMAAPGYRFVSWTGVDSSAASASATVTVNSARSVTANFAEEVPCTFSLSSSSISLSTAAGNTVVLIQASRAGCAWTARSNSSFVTITGATTGSGSGAVTVNYAANTGAGRTGTVTMGGQTFTVIQSGTTCDFSLSPSTISTSATGGVYNAALTLTGTQCRWVVQQPPSVTANPGEGNAAGTFNQSFTVYPNFATQARTLLVYVGNAAMTINQSGNPLTSNERFVQLVYFAFLGRLPASAELTSQSASLTAGTSRDDMIVSFFSSQEFNAKGRFVAGLYVGLLNRDAEFNGWIFQRGALQNGVVTLPGLVTNFINSTEFQLQNGALSNENYVRLLYRQVLLRDPNASEVSGQASALSTSVTTRTNMAYGFLASPEFQGGTGPRLTAFLLYAGLLQRDATTAERSTLMTQIQSGTTVRAAALNILNSNEFGDFLK